MPAGRRDRRILALKDKVMSLLKDQIEGINEAAEREIRAILDAAKARWTACTYEAREGLVIQTKSPRVVKARQMLAELLVASAPNVKMARDIAARFGLLKVRFPMEDNRCILCGLCIRMCYEQMDGKALGFGGRGTGRKISMPFEVRPETSRLCRGCDYVCPGVIVPCHGVKEPGEFCGKCVRLKEMPNCCEFGTFGCFCEHNPL